MGVELERAVLNMGNALGHMMGYLSEEWNREKETWIVPHRLNVRADLRQEQVALLHNFGPTLKLCFKNQSKNGVSYQHWWVADKNTNWVIEFGGGEVWDCTVLVHSKARHNYIIDCEFTNTPEVRERMQKVCGTTNYSLALRNCEHVARYIRYGSWLCFQMVGDGVLKETFFSHMSGYTKLINIFPEELRPAEFEHNIIYPIEHINGFHLNWECKKEALVAADNNAYNIVFLGPTGSGKSTMINEAFNCTVCETAASADSVTRQVVFHQGSHSLWKSTRGDGTVPQVKVNVIDTIGKG